MAVAVPILWIRIRTLDLQGAGVFVLLLSENFCFFHVHPMLGIHMLILNSL